MAVLRSAVSSPFVRKCAIATIVLGLEDKVESLPASTADPLDPLRQQNPLGKIPTLVLDDGRCLYDSRVIMAYLDHLAGGNRLYPSDPMDRIDAMRLEALADGIMDAAILQVYEKRYREEHERSVSWVERQAERVASALAVLEAGPPPGIGRAKRRVDCRGMRARLSGSAFRRGLAAHPSGAGCMARRFQGGRAGLRCHRARPAGSAGRLTGNHLSRQDRRGTTLVFCHGTSHMHVIMQA